MREYQGPIPYITFDTNCINSRGGMPEMNYLEGLRDQDLITIYVSQAMFEELPPAKRALVAKACQYCFLGGERLMHQEQEDWQRLRNIIFPNKANLSERDKRDVQHLFDHAKYSMSQWPFFVTNDHHFLDHKEELDEEGIRVGTPEECVQWLAPILSIVKQRIQQWQERTKSSSEQSPAECLVQSKRKMRNNF